MLVRNVAALLCSGVLAASALRLDALEDLYDSGVESTFDLSNVLQVPFGTPGVQEGDQVVLDYDVENDLGQISQKAEEKTIYQVLSANPKFSRLVKIIDVSDEVVSLLNDSSADITFFAASNRALRVPKRRKRHARNTTADTLDDPAALLEAYSSYDLPEIMAEIEELESCLDNEPDKERRKKIIRILVKAIVFYHVIPNGIDVESLTHNTTYATKLVLPDGSLDKEALRVRVSHKIIPPSVHINFFSKVVKPNIGAKNGVIHVVNHPLLPPPSIFQEIFVAPRIFGAVTSGLQRIGLTDAVEWRYVPKKGDDDKKWTVEGSSSTTFFVPSNLAFKKLPWKLELFLFSPFGEKVLKKLLQFHVVPGIVLHSDYLHNATSGETVSANAWPEVFDELDVEYLEKNPSELGYDKGVDFGTVRKGRPFSYRHGDSRCTDLGADYDEEVEFGTIRGRPFSYRHGDSRPTELGLDHGGDDEPHHLPSLRTPPRNGRGNHHGFNHPTPPPPPPPPLSGDYPRHPHGPFLPPPFRGPGGAPLKGDHCEPYNEGGSLPCLPHLPRKPVFSANVTLPTLLKNHSLHVRVAKVKHRLPIPGHKMDIYTTKLFVNHQSVAVSDVVSRNGAVHVINKVLNPRPRHHRRPHQPEEVEGGYDCVDEEDNDEWEDWEDWLLQWAE